MLRAPANFPHPLLHPLPYAPQPLLRLLPSLLTGLQVRQRAALNLGELTRMSMRADQLVAGEWGMDS